MKDTGIISIEPVKYPWYKRLKYKIGNILLFGIPYLSRLIRYIWWDILNRGPFGKLAFPIIKRVDYNSAIRDLINVQPMDGPMGTVFYMNFKYATSNKCYKGINETDKKINS